MKTTIKFFQVLLLVLAVLCTACDKDELYEPIAPEKPQSTKFSNSLNALRIKLEGENKSFERLLPSRAVVFKSQIWCFNQKVSATINTPNNLIHIWSSSDGTQFSLKSSIAAPYAHFRNLVVFNNKLWLIGGQGTSGIWHSEDGLAWSQLAIIPPFRNTSNRSVIVFKGKMFVFETDRNGAKRVFSSTNGRSWLLENGNAFSTTESGRPVVFKDALYYIAGRDDHSTSPKAIHDIYWSTNGRDWSKLDRGLAPFPTTTIFKGVNWFGMAVFDDKMWFIGGSTVGRTPHESEIWSSSDMIHWTKYKGTVPFGWRRNHTAIAFKDRILLMGGYKKSQNYYAADASKEIWSIRPNTGLHLQ